MRTHRLSPSMPCLRRSVGALFIVSCLTAASASAATYRVHSCSLPDGRVIPADGWRAETSGAGGSAPQGCSYGIASARGLIGSLYGNSPPGSYAGWTFTAPAHTTIRGYTIWRTVRAASGADGWFHDYVLSHDAPRSLDQRYLVEFCSRYALCDSLGLGPTDRLSSAKRMSRSSLEIRRLGRRRRDMTGNSCGRWRLTWRRSVPSGRIVDRSSPQGT